MVHKKLNSDQPTGRFDRLLVSGKWFGKIINNVHFSILLISQENMSNFDLFSNQRIGRNFFRANMFGKHQETIL